MKRNTESARESEKARERVGEGGVTVGVAVAVAVTGTGAGAGGATKTQISHLQQAALHHFMLLRRTLYVLVHALAPALTPPLAKASPPTLCSCCRLIGGAVGRVDWFTISVIPC